MKNSGKTYFWYGFTSILDLYPDLNFCSQHHGINGTERDWQAVGNDLRHALSSYDEQRNGGTGQRSEKHSRKTSACST